MGIFERPNSVNSNWASLIAWAIAALIISTVVSGCRVGNYVQEAPPPPPNPDQISGFYLTKPQSLKYYVTTAPSPSPSGSPDNSTTANTTLNATGPVSMIPVSITATLTNPVLIAMQDLKSGSAALATYEGENAFPMVVNSDLTLSGTWDTPAQTYWQDSGCQSYLEVTEMGALTKDTTLTPPTGTVPAVAGKMQIQFQVVAKFRGTCTATFQALANCYQDLTQCGGTNPTDNQQRQNDVSSVFDPLIQLKLIAAPDIANIVNYAFEASYQ